MLIQEPVEEQVGADDDEVTDVENQLVERHHSHQRDGEVIPGVEAGSVEDEGHVWPVVESRDDVEDIDPLADQDEHQGELISPVDLLDVDLEAAADVEEPDEAGAGVVDQAR